MNKRDALDPLPWCLRLGAHARCIGAAVLWSTIAWPGQVVAQTFLGPTPYLSESDSPFAASIAAGTTVLEDFEDGTLLPGVAASAGSPFAPSNGTDSVDGDDGMIDGSGKDGWSFFSPSGPNGITFTFDAVTLGALPTHVGIVWTDGSGTTLFEAFGPGGAPLGAIGPVALADGPFTGQTGEDRFFGVEDPGGIGSIKVSNSGGGIEVDHLQLGSVEVNQGSCVRDAQTACLLGGRFEVKVRMWDFSSPPVLFPGIIQSYQGASSETDQTASYYSFQEGNVEVFVKMVNACAAPAFHSFWLFAAGATNAETEILVRDTMAEETYRIHNPANVLFEPLADTSAFETCDL